MPPKPSKTEIPQYEPTPDELVEALNANKDGEHVVTELLEELLALTHDQLRSKRIREATVAHAVADMMDDISVILAWHFNDCDPGEPDVATSEKWAPDMEPQPAEIDAWSRGAVPARRRMLLSAPPTGSAVAAANSLGDTRRASTMARSPRTSQRASQHASAEGSGLPEKSTVFIAKAPAASAPVKKKHEPAIVTDNERRAARMAAEQKAEQERMEFLKSQLNGRDYVYDRKGGVIPVESVVADKLPPFQQVPRVSVPESKNEGKTAAGATRAGRKGGMGKVKVDFSKNARFHELDSMQPPLMETMVMSEGVRLVEGEAIKEGEQRQVNPERLSRKEFEAKMAGIDIGTLKKTITDPASSVADVALPSTAERSPPAATAATLKKDFGETMAQGPAKLPVRMPAPQRSLGEGTEPRNKSFRERGGTAVKVKLPPPMMPATVGFGLELPYSTRPSSLNSSVTRQSGFSPPRSTPPATVKTTNPALLKQLID